MISTEKEAFNFGSLDDDLDFAATKVTKVVEFVELCYKCGGSGRYYHNSSHGTACFHCKGTGRLTFKTSKEQRAKAKTSSAARKEKKEVEFLSNFENSNPEIAAWWSGSSFDFAISLRESVKKYGSLTEGQMAAATRCVEKLKATKASKKQALLNAAEVDISGIEEAFKNGQSKGIKRPKIRLLEEENAFVFSLAPATGRNAGAVYVVAGEEYIGKIAAGKFVKSSACSANLESSVLAACKDPLKSAVAYGRRFGVCSCCGRELTNQESIDLGIGPICKDKFF